MFRNKLNVIRSPSIVLIICTVVAGVPSYVFSSSERDIIDKLVRQWAPLVWLAPGEKYMPGSVTDFLHNVHAEESENMKSNGAFDEDDSYYNKHKFAIFDKMKSSESYLLNQHQQQLTEKITSQMLKQRQGLRQQNRRTQKRNRRGSDDKPEVNLSSWEGRNKRLYYDQSLFMEYIIGMPVGDTSENWNLVTNDDLETLLDNSTSFIYGQNPDLAPVPIYAMINACSPIKAVEDQDYSTDNGKKTYPENTSYPNFHVTYWLFFPYNRGKSICSIYLGPLGQVPMPMNTDVCLGKTIELGNHIGDWEHLSLSFRGRADPDEMYVSTHDSGAYYKYDRYSNSFNYRRQETRTGFLQNPDFPPLVQTSNKHPVLFAAKGSHGIWAQPGNHTFIPIPRLEDVNGFGIPWATWKKIEIIYEEDITRRSFTKNWVHFEGRWGNSKSKCHPLERIGLNLCKFSDGPKGITNRLAHFQCAARPSPAGSS